jgi:uncharacterized protein YqgC (DUF456 family)
MSGDESGEDGGGGRDRPEEFASIPRPAASETVRLSQLFARSACLGGMVEVFTWSLSALLMLAGVAGVIVPLLPGTTLILLAAIAHKLILPAEISWLAIGVIAGIWLLSIAADFAGVAVGARWLGGSRWGMAGASGGALVGIFFSLPAVLLGTILGAIAAEKLFAKKSDAAALKAGVGAAMGFVLAAVARLACAGAMIAVFLGAALDRGTR